MDLHAHLSNYEVIGLLGGTWDPAAQRIQVRDQLHGRFGAGGLDPKPRKPGVDLQMPTQGRAGLELGWSRGTRRAGQCAARRSFSLLGTVRACS